MKKQACALLAALILYSGTAYGQGWRIEATGSIYENWGSAQVVAAQGDYACVGMMQDVDSGLLSVVDISAPSAPVELSSMALHDEIGALAMQGGVLYVGLKNLGLVTLDISNPLLPALLSTLTTPPGFRDLTLSGNRMYAVHSTNWYHTAIAIYDLTDPTQPALLGSYVFEAVVMDADVAGNFVYASSYTGGFWVLDVSNPALPVLVGQLTIPDNGLSVAVQGDYVYFGSSDHIFTLDVSNPANPMVVGDAIVGGWFADLIISGELLYANGSYSGVTILSLSNPAHPAFLSNCPNSDNLADMTLTGNTILGASGGNGIKVLDMTVPQSPALLCIYSAQRNFQEVAVRDNLAYLAAQPGGFLIVDVSDPSAMVQIGCLNTIGSATHLLLQGDYAYVAGNWQDSSTIVNVSDPEHPFVAGQYYLNGHFADYVEDTGLAYACDTWYGIKIFDLSTPTNPALVGSYQDPSGGIVWDLAVDGDFLFAIAGYYDDLDDWYGDSLIVLNIGNPVAPVLVSMSDLAQDPKRIEIADGYAYIAGSNPDLRVVDISNPAAPITVGTVNYTGTATGLQVVGDYVYLTGYGYLRAINAANPTHLVPTGNYKLPQQAPLDVVVQDEVAFVCNGERFETYDCSAASPLAEFSGIEAPPVGSSAPEICNLMRVRPNPFNPTTAISYQLSADSHVKLQVFDISGRPVATLVDGWGKAGLHEVTFDGSNLPSGIYIYRITAGNWSASEKMILLK